METEVAVIGLGPTGATLANLLAECGVRVTVIEREAQAYHLPRAVHFDGETMRVFQAAGIANALADKVHINPGMKFVAPDGTLLLDWPRPEGIGPQGWHSSYRLHQPDLEALLRDKLATRPGVAILTDTEVTALSETPEGVSLTCQNRATGTESSVTAAYAVGCDGARSFVRRAMGTGYEDLGFQERWLVIDVLLQRNRPDLGDHSIQYCDPSRPMTYCRSPGIRRRWEITLRDGEAEAEMTRPERIWQFLAPWITPEDADLERSAIYTFRSAIAREWRKGRLMIAGDAAHLTPPFMGQGMCTGIRDAANLAWKLADVARGRAKPAILDSYQAERGPHARAFIETAMRLGGLINALDGQSALAMAEEGGQMKTIAPPLGQSDLISDTPHSGTLFPQPRLANGQMLDHAIGYRPVTIQRDRSATDDETPCLVAKDHPGLASVLDALKVETVHLRPDKYISGTGIDP